jgi:hypothetical protein
MANKSLNYALKLTDSQTIVNLPVKLNGVKKLKIKSFKYQTATDGNDFMLVNISGWNENSVYYDGAKPLNFTKLIFLPALKDQTALYENPSSTDYYDVIRSTKVDSLANFQIELKIDGSYTSDITVSNPVYLELYVE